MLAETWRVTSTGGMDAIALTARCRPALVERTSLCDDNSYSDGGLGQLGWLERRMLASVSPEEALPTARAWLRECDYEDSLIKPNWSLRHMDTGRTDLMIPYMAFWNQPFDLFHTALAVVQQNGVPAQDIAARTASNVLLCADSTVELWLLDEQDGIAPVSRVPVQQAPAMIAEYKERLCRDKVKKEKIRWRQYALYEADPNGNAFPGWSTQPSATQADRSLKKLIREVVPIPAKGKKATAEQLDVLRDRSRWLFRLLSLRVGKDRDWGIASHLSRSNVSGFAECAKLYPVSWPSDTSHLTASEQEIISERVLSRLEHYDFSTVDPLFVTKAVRASTLSQLRSAIDLFPTPKPFAWDMMASIPLHEGTCVCDATAGTGTFLIAAGHAVWNEANLGNGELPNLRQMLRGGDKSHFSTDLAQISLDLAFGWQETGWNVRVAAARQTLEEMPADRQWALVGNLPWSAKGKGRNTSALVLENYVDALSRRDAGWIAVIVPRSVWTSTKQLDVRLRERMTEALQLESAWELPWGAIGGGRAQAVAALLSKGQPATTSIWKQVDEGGAVHTVGYSRPKRNPDDCLSAPAQYLQTRLAGLSVLRDWFDVWEGVKFRGELSGNPQSGGTVPFILRQADVGVDVRRPQRLTLADITGKGGWIQQNSRRRAKSYGADLQKLPQFAIPRHVYEGTSERMYALFMMKPILLSDAFLISVPKGDFTVTFTHGVAALLNTALGRLWLHVFATAGRDLSNQRVMDFPLPPRDQVERWGRLAARRTSRHFLGSTHYDIFQPSFSFDEELSACREYGLRDDECAAVLALSSLLGIKGRIPRRWLDRLDGVLPDAAKIDELLQEAKRLELEEVDLSDLYLDVFSERRKRERIVAVGKECEVAIKRVAVTKDDNE